MMIVFESEEEKVRLEAMVDHANFQIDMTIKDRILLLNVKNILTFFQIKIDRGAITQTIDVNPHQKQLPAPKERKQA
jgi:hypothetical protein